MHEKVRRHQFLPRLGPCVRVLSSFFEGRGASSQQAFFFELVTRKEMAEIGLPLFPAISPRQRNPPTTLPPPPPTKVGRAGAHPPPRVPKPHSIPGPVPRRPPTMPRRPPTMPPGAAGKSHRRRRVFVWKEGSRRAQHPPHLAVSHSSTSP